MQLDDRKSAQHIFILFKYIIIFHTPRLYFNITDNAKKITSQLRIPISIARYTIYAIELSVTNGVL